VRVMVLKYWKLATSIASERSENGGPSVRYEPGRSASIRPCTPRTA